MVMEAIQCSHCGDFFPPSPRHKNQRYCMKAPCRRARKADWKRQKLRTDPDYRLNRDMSNRKWAQSRPGYWSEYRRRHPDKAERNRLLQAIRNRRRAVKQAKAGEGTGELIAKVDASIPSKIKVVGQFWMVPVIAKVDASKVNIYEIPGVW
jgi:hypothetical protein